MTVVPEKADLFGVGVSVTSFEAATRAVVDAARDRRSLGVTALATHGLMEAVRDRSLADAVNRLDVVTPDGQPVRWALNALHGAELDERVYGPDLTVAVCEAAAREGIGVYLYGSTAETCERMVANLRAQFPGLRVSGVQPDRFREATPQEDDADVARIVASGAGVVLVGRGCPRQERWVAAHRGRIPAAMLGVGAAFDYIAGTLERPPAWMQRAGLEWLFRLWKEPRRLWRRYVVNNSHFLLRFGQARARLALTRTAGRDGRGGDL